MKKKHRLWKILSAFSLSLVLAGCTSLDYVGEDGESVKTARIQTSENFNVQTVEKSLQDVNIKVGISETDLDMALALYIGIQNNSDSAYKFSMEDVRAYSPVGEISFINPSDYIEAYQNYQASNYINMLGASTTLNSFASLQSNYNQQRYSNTQTAVENANSNPELLAIERTIAGIQNHTIKTYDFVAKNSYRYFYIFLIKPTEYPIVVKYKDLTYKFGGKKNGAE